MIIFPYRVGTTSAFFVLLFRFYDAGVTHAERSERYALHMKPRSDLDKMLDVLERDLAGMRERLPNEEEFWREFSERANGIRDSSSPHDLVHVDGRVQQMLTSAGLTKKPGE